MYVVKSLEKYGKSKGVVASQNIGCGTRIMSCKPIILSRRYDSRADTGVVTALQLILKNDKKVREECKSRERSPLLRSAYFKTIGILDQFPGRESEFFPNDPVLPYVDMFATMLDMLNEPDADTEPEKSEDKQYTFDLILDLLNLFETNRLFLERHADNGCGLFYQASLLNHSCRPNAIPTWNEDTQRLNIHALRTIQTDEEITISYVPDGTFDRKDRRAWLREVYGFECICEVCTSESKDECEARRERIQAHQSRLVLLLRKLQVYPPPGRDMTDALAKQVLVELNAAIKESRAEFTPDIHLTWFYMTKVLALSRRHDSLGVAETLFKAYRITSICYGHDHPYAQQQYMLLQKVNGCLDDPEDVEYHVALLSGDYMTPELTYAPPDRVAGIKATKQREKDIAALVKQWRLQDRNWYGIPFAEEP